MINRLIVASLFCNAIYSSVQGVLQSQVLSCGDFANGSFTKLDLDGHVFQIDISPAGTKVVTFQTCNSPFEWHSGLRLYNYANGVPSSATAIGECNNAVPPDCALCHHQSFHEIWNVTLHTTYYYIEIYTHQEGVYRLDIDCIPDPSNSQTNPTTTVSPTTNKPTTIFPTTLLPTTSAPTTLFPTIVPTTTAPTTTAPTTTAPTTLFPTIAPINNVPTTTAPTTNIPTTALPTTSVPTTSMPTSSNPTTSQPTTNEPTKYDGNTNTESDDALSSGGNDSLTDNLFVFVLLSVVITLIICIILICLYRKQKSNSKPGNINNSTELERVVSASENKYEFMANSPSSMTSIKKTPPQVNMLDAPGSPSTNTTIIGSNANTESPEPTMKLVEYDALGNWLNKMKLMEYYAVFLEQGFADRMETLSKLSDTDLMEMNITKIAHRREILSSIATNNHNVDSTNSVMTGEGVESVTSMPNSLNSDDITMDMEMDNFEEDGNDGADEAMYAKKGKTSTPGVVDTTKGDIQENDENEYDANGDPMYAKGGHVTSGK